MSYFLCCALRKRPGPHAKENSKVNKSAVKASIATKRIAVVALSRSIRACDQRQGTGVLIQNSLVLTSHMTLPSKESAEDGEIVFTDGYTDSSSYSIIPPSERPIHTIMTRKLLPTRYFITNPSLGVTVVGCDSVSSEVPPLQFGVEVPGDILNVGHSIYVLGHVQHDDEQKGLIMFGEGRISSEDEQIIEFYSLDGNVWAPGSAGFDEHGNFAFVVGDSKPPSAANFASSPEERPPDSGPKQPGILVQFVREWMRFMWDGAFDIIMGYKPSTTKEFGGAQGISDDRAAQIVQQVWGGGKGANGEDMELPIQSRPGREYPNKGKEGASVYSFVESLDTPLLNSDVPEVRLSKDPPCFCPPCPPFTLGGIADLATNELTTKKSDHGSVLVSLESNDTGQEEFLNTIDIEGDQRSSAHHNDFVTGFVNMAYFNKSILSPDRPVVDSPEQDANRTSCFHWGKRTPNSSPLCKTETTKSNCEDSDGVRLESYNSNVILPQWILPGLETPEDSNLRLLGSETITPVATRDNTSWPENYLLSGPRSPGNSPPEIPPPLSHFKRLYQPISLASPRQTTKAVHPEIAFGLIHRSTSPRPPQKAEAIPWRPSGCHGSGDLGSPRQKAEFATEERKVTPVGSPRHGAPRLLTERRRRGCDREEKKPEAGAMRKRREKEQPGKPRWSEHSKVHKEDHNRKLASLPPRVVKLGEFPAELFSSQLTVNVPPQVCKGTGAEPAGKGKQVANIESQELDAADVLPDLFIGSRPRFPRAHSPKVQNSLASRKVAEKRKRVGSEEGWSSNLAVRRNVGVGVLELDRGRVDYRPQNCSVSSNSDEEDQAAPHSSRVSSKHSARKELYSLKNPSESDEQIRRVVVSPTGIERVTSAVPERPAVSRCSSPDADQKEQIVLRCPRGRSQAMGREGQPNLWEAENDKLFASKSPKVAIDEEQLLLRSPKQEVTSKLQMKAMLKSSCSSITVSKFPVESSLGFKASSEHPSKDLEALASPRMRARTNRKTEAQMIWKQTPQSSASSSVSPRAPAGSKSSKRIDNDEEILKEIERIQAVILRSPRETLCSQAVPGKSSNKEETKMSIDQGKEMSSQLKDMEMQRRELVPADTVGTGSFDTFPREFWTVTKSHPSPKQKPDQVTENTCFQHWKNILTQRKDRVVESMKSVFSSQPAACTVYPPAGLPLTTLSGDLRCGGLQNVSENQSQKSSVNGSPASGPFWPFKEGAEAFDGTYSPQRYVNLHSPQQSQRPLWALQQAPVQETITVAFAGTSPVQLPLLCKERKVDGSLLPKATGQSVNSDWPTPEAQRTVWNETFSSPDDPVQIQPEMQNLWTALISSHFKPEPDSQFKQGQSLLASAEVSSPKIYGCGQVSPSIITTANSAPVGGKMANAGPVCSKMTNVATSSDIDDAPAQQKYRLTASAVPKKQTSMDAGPGRPRWSITRVDGGSTTTMDPLAALRKEKSMKDLKEESDGKKRSSVDAGLKVFVLDTDQKDEATAKKHLALKELPVAKDKLPASSLSDAECSERAPLDMGNKPKSSAASLNNLKQDRPGTPKCKKPTSAKRNMLTRASTAEVGTNVVFSSSQEGPLLSEKGMIVRTEVTCLTPGKGQAAPPEKGMPRWRP